MNTDTKKFTLVRLMLFPFAYIVVMCCHAATVTADSSPKFVDIPNFGAITPNVLKPVVENEKETGEKGAMISFENGLLDHDGTTSTIDLPFMNHYTFAPLSELVRIRTEIAEKSEGRLVLQLIHGVPCVLPTGKGRTKRMLQRPITLHLKNASTWEAIKALVDAVNAPSDDLWPMHIHVTTLLRTMPPPEAGVKKLL